MPRFDPVQTNFSAGEVSPRLLGNFQIDKYKQGLKTLENMNVLTHGGVSRRGGFKYVAEVKTSAKTTILQEFKYKDEFSYILEFGDLYIRFYRNQAQIGAPYEVVTTYAEAELRDLRFTQDEDTLYIVHKNHLPAQLTRTAHDNWTLANVAFSYDGVATVDTIVEPVIEPAKWILQSTPVDNSWRGICWSPELSLFVAVAYTGTGDRVMTSSDGMTWRYHTGISNPDWISVCWSPELSLFCAVASDGHPNQIMTSPNGAIWTDRTTPLGNGWQSVCWSPELTLFVAVAISGTGNRVMTSPDGIAWTLRDSAADNGWYSVCWSPELTLFVAVANTGHPNQVMTSSNGIDWDIRTTPVDNDWYAVCWSPELTLFVATAISGTDNRVMTSPDGITWTIRTTPVDNDWMSVCWSPELGIFVSVALTGSEDRVMTSPDGITWTIGVTPADYVWRAVCWSPELTRFVAVASDGHPDMAMVYNFEGLFDGTYTLVPLTEGEGSGCEATIVVVDNAIDSITVTTAGALYVIDDTLSIDPLLIGGSTGPITCDVATLTSSDIPSDWGAANYPTLVWFFEQRLFFASTPDEPNRIWGSRTADYDNFYEGIGLAAEALIFSIKEATKLLWVTTSNVILLGAHNAPFKISANTLNEALTPTNIRAVKIANYGNAFLPAIDLDGDSVFVQRGLRKIRRLEYDSIKDKHKAIDITILSNHITESGLIDIAYIDEPNPMICGVRTDGELACLTYEPEFGIFGWSRHLVGGTDAKVKSIAASDAVTADEDELWAIIERTVDGSTVQYVEFLTQGLSPEDDIEDATFMDSFVTKIASDTNMITNGDFSVDVTGWTPDNSATLFAVPSPPGKEGKCMRVLCDGEDNPGATQEIVVVAGGGYTVEGYVYWGEPSSEQTYRVYVWDVDNGGILADTGELEETASDWSTKFELDFEAPAGCTTVRLYLVLVALADDASAIWYDSIYMSEKIIVFDGLDHLEGETVNVFADGLVQATKVVSSGEITLDTSAYLAHAGLACDAVIETLPLEGGNPVGSAMGKIKRISHVVLRLYRSLAFTIGDLFDSNTEDVDLGATLFTDDTEELDFYGDYETGGQMKITITDPVPFSLLAAMYKARTGE